MSISLELQNKIEEALQPYREFTPLELAKHLEFDVVYVEERNDFSGAIKKNIDSGKVRIYINDKHPTSRKLFTLAHEIGHYFLHREFLSNGIISYRQSDSEQYSKDEKEREFEANHFAAEMLMPKKVFTNYFYKYLDTDREKLIEKMADFFAVSKDSVKVRISYLGL